MTVEDLTVLMPSDEVDGNVGAVVGDPLDVGQDLKEHKAGVDGTHPALQTFDVPVFQGVLNGVDGLLQRLDLPCQRKIAVFKGFVCHSHDMLHGGADDVQLLNGLAAELDVLVVKAFRPLHQIDGVVANSFKFHRQAEHQGDILAFLIRQLAFTDLAQIAVQPVFHLVDLCFRCLNGLHHL